MVKQFLQSVSEPIVDTTGGKIRGFQFDKIYKFYGIKYADAERFQKPKPVKPWDGVKDALCYGHICPHMDRSSLPGDLTAGLPRMWPENEHCQYLNIWTDTLDKKAKKSVMVWLHGGMFTIGSSMELDCYDGENMAKFRDVVFVSLNHRLNILGHLDMTGFDSKYENSVNAGMADIVEALKWIRDNIESFGGNPDNITIYGHSGGGRKVTTLMQTPEAKGLFHKGIIQSGTALWNPVSSKHHKKLVEFMLDELDIPHSEYTALERVPYPVLIRAYNRAGAKLLEQDGIQNEWYPVKNDWFLGAPPFHAFTEYANKVPLIIGSVIAEVPVSPPMPDKDSYSPEKRREIIKDMYGDAADRLIELFKKAYPDKNELLLLDLDQRYRPNLLNYVDRKLDEADPGVPVYVYMFSLEFDINGRKGAWHGAEMPFTFHNAEAVPAYQIDGVRDKLQNEMSGAWASFAHTGDPNHSGLAEKWPKYDKASRGVMIFDRTSSVRYDHEKELVALHKTVLDELGITGRSPQTFNVDKEKWLY